MLDSIEQCMQLSMPEMKKIERCFSIANTYWEKLKESLRGKDFESEEEEIAFFKNVKPLFTSQMEYYCILSEAILFVPDEKERARLYWIQERDRYQRFLRKYDVFFEYLQEGQNYFDSFYFLRKNYVLVQTWDLPIYDVEIEFCTTYDGLVRRFLAKKRYDEYAEYRLSLLK